MKKQIKRLDSFILGAMVVNTIADLEAGAAFWVIAINVVITVGLIVMLLIPRRKKRTGDSL